MQPDAYQREHLIDGVGFELPPRRAAKPVALFLFVLGLVFAGVGVRFIYQLIESLDTASLFDIVFGIFGLFPLLIGLVPITIAMVLLAGRNTIQVRCGEVSAIDRLGPLRWTRTRAAERIAQLEVNTGTVSTNKGPAKPMQGFAILVGLSPDAEDKSPGKARYKSMFILAWGYPRKLLLDLAGELSRELDPDGRRLVGGHAAAIPVIERFGSEGFLGTLTQDQQEDAPAPRPADARSILERTPDGLTFTVPPAGFWKGSKGLGCFGIIWTAFMAVFTGGAIYGIFFDNSINGQDIDTLGEMLGGAAFVSLFWLIGLGMLTAALNMGRRRAIIDAIGSPPHATLLISHQSLFRTRQHEWPAAELSHLCIGPSGMEVNDRPVMELQIHPMQGKKVGLLSQLDDHEIRWIAYELRQALGVPAAPPLAA